MIGFIEAGKALKNSLLKISAFLMLGSMAVIELYDILSIFSNLTLEDFMIVKGFESIAFGGVDIVFGIALIKMREKVGLAAPAAGIFEIIVGVCFISFLLAFIGLFFMIPAVLLEIIVLYKCYELVQGKS